MKALRKRRRNVLFFFVSSMPRKKTVYTLRKISLAQIVENLWTAWGKSRVDDPNILANVQQVYEYLDIPISINWDILHGLATNHIVMTGHLLTLLNRGLDRIDLTPRENATIDLDLILNSSLGGPRKKVQYLSLCGRFEYVSLSTVLKLSESFSGLQELHLAYAGCNDECVRLLTLNCLNLRTLDLTRCPITDRAVRYLCYSSADQHCISNILQRLCIRGTRVTSHGAADALRHLKVLQELVFNGMFEAIFAANGLSNWKHMKSYTDVRRKLHSLKAHSYELRALRLNCIPPALRAQENLYQSLIGRQDGFLFEMLPDCIALIGQTCPKLEKFNIVIDQDLAEHTLAPLASCSHLRSFGLRRRMERHRGIGFDQVHNTDFEIVNPVLASSCGHHLRELLLSGVSDLELVVIARSAPKLETLFLQNVSIPEDDDEESDSAGEEYSFPTLRKLYLGDASYGLLETIVTRTMGLQVLDLYRLVDFSDTFIYQHEMHLREIRRLSVSRCTGLTHLAIMFLLWMHDSPLEELNLYQNFSLRMSFMEINSWLHNRNFDVNITSINTAPFFEDSDEAYGTCVFHVARY